VTVRVFGSAVKHRGARPAGSDIRLVLTRCGFRFLWSPLAYRDAQRIMGRPEPSGMCPGCAA
jgi:hypothetical protein